MTPVTIAGIPIGDGHPCRIVAEIGTNHGGDLDLAKWLIKMAKDVGCDLVKGQCRTPELAVPRDEWEEFRDTPWGKMKKIDYRRRVEFNDKQWAELFDYAERVSIPLFASVWDEPALGSMEALPSPCYKIPSARLHDRRLVMGAASDGRPLILSTGMSDMNDVRAAVMWASGGASAARKELKLILLQATSAYPAKAEESNLRVIRYYKDCFDCPVGFSSHKIGIATCLLAVAVGANMIERHVTWSREARGSDHRMSSTVEDLKRLVQEIRYAEACLGTGVKCIEQSEMAEAKRLRGAV